MRFRYPYFLRKRRCVKIKYRSFEDVKEVYGESNLCRICNIKQILTYAKMKVQPVWIDEGYGGAADRLLFYPGDQGSLEILAGKQAGN